jgi:tetratricopeptide (TPR) repeat protein
MKKYIILIVIVFWSCQNENDFRKKIQNKIEKNNYEGAISDLKARLKINSTDPEFIIYYYDLGSCYFSLKNYELALKNYKNYFAKKNGRKFRYYDTYDGLAYFDRGVVKYNLGDYKGSLIDLDATIKLDPEDPSAYFDRAKARSKLGMKVKACIDMEFCKSIYVKSENSENIFLPIGEAEKYYNEFSELYRECNCEYIKKILSEAQNIDTN